MTQPIISNYYIFRKEDISKVFTVFCCILGVGTIISWNNMLTVEDYYYQVFPDYHPSRVFIVVYQPFGLGTIMIFSYRESKINTQKRNMIGCMLSTISTFLLIAVNPSLVLHKSSEIGF
ncbi:putative equilibrative nucleoside transporter [Arabidopsis thaliana]